MFSTLRTRFGIPGVISVMALVFAMLGGAYAANNSSDNGKATASAKAKKGQRGPKGPKGDTGPAGPAGPAGPQGAKGDAGANGSNGAEGKQGPEGKQGKEGKAGKDGLTGFTETLPSGKTETGTWSAQAYLAPEEVYPFPISYSIPLATPSEKIVYLNKTETENSSTTPKEGCKLDTLNLSAGPIAPAGTLCVFTLEEVEGKVIEIGSKPSTTADSPMGTFVRAKTSPELLEGTGLVSIAGAWAVTAK